MKDLLGYEGKRTVVTGAFSGMGEAVARAVKDLGAEVIALDYKPITSGVDRFIEVNLMEKDSIDAALGQVDGEIDVLLNCAGIPGAPWSNLETMTVNFIGLRHLTEGLIPQIKNGGAIASITSVAGMGYLQNLEKVREFLATPGFDEAKAWCEANPMVANGYLFSKQAIIGYTQQRATQLCEREVRINCLSPAPTDTPMLPDFHSQVSKEFLEEHFLAPVGRNATPEEMAEPLVFLGSNMARFISGHNLFVDYGFVGSVQIGDAKTMLVP
jgi:NAD(P)-dependent dehydrogenase (short-subunit alcohol dehydrogenase family)